MTINDGSSEINSRAMVHSDLDKRALKILFASYWSNSRWKQEFDTAPADLAYAKAAGLMFDPITISHQQAVEWAIRSRDSVSKEQVVNFFLASLTSRRLDLRSALGCFAVARNLRAHVWNKSNSPTRYCPVCGMYEHLEKPEDLNVLNFERFKWGGVRHPNPIYIALDLQEVAKQPTPKPSSADARIMAAILNVARTIQEKSKLSDLVKQLAPILPSNVPERRALIGILGHCGILIDPSRESFFESFPHFSAREYTRWQKDDWPYPVRWWQGSFGVAEKAATYWFPAL
ncbi:MAG: hypothetical protein WCF88_01445 [Candidatus Acidiferrales bacterium]|jgi:hypothetical protein